MPKGLFTGIIGSTGSLFKYVLYIFFFFFFHFIGIFRGCNAKSVCVHASLLRFNIARDLYNSSFPFPLRRSFSPADNSREEITDNIHSFLNIYIFSRRFLFMYKKLTSYVGYTCIRARHASRGANKLNFTLGLPLYYYAPRVSFLSVVRATSPISLSIWDQSNVCALRRLRLKERAERDRQTRS